MARCSEGTADRNRAIQALVREELSAGGQIFRLEVTSGSMSPLIRPGDWVVLAPLATAHPCIGDILVLPAGSDWIVHRLVDYAGGADERRMITKGDQTPEADAPWDEELLIGRVSAVERGGAQILLDASLGARILSRLAVWGWIVWSPGKRRVFRRAAWRVLRLISAVTAWLVWLTR